MDIQKSYKTHFRYKNKFYEAVIKVTAFFNGYKIARVIINHEQYWALYDRVSWKLMPDQRKKDLFHRSIINHFKNQARTKTTRDKI
jgi:hypothetical protein